MSTQRLSKALCTNAGMKVNLFFSINCFLQQAGTCLLTIFAECRFCQQRYCKSRKLNSKKNPTHKDRNNKLSKLIKCAYILFLIIKINDPGNADTILRSLLLTRSVLKMFIFLKSKTGYGFSERSHLKHILLNFTVSDTEKI